MKVAMASKSDGDLNSRSTKGHIRDVENTTMEPESLSPQNAMASSSAQQGGDGETDEGNREGGSLRGDMTSILLLMFLYVLQGIILGITATIPKLLQSRNVSYKEQAVFSLVYWPFSLKLLWAPLVDSIYSQCFGRRKSWLIPTQYLIGSFMLVLSTQVNSLMGDSGDASSGQVNILALTYSFLALNFLAATQDIAVDGWALTMLSRCNVGWASTCNFVGQVAGVFVSYVLFVPLQSADFCNTYLRSEPQAEGLLTLSGFLSFWGVVFFVSTTLVGLLKYEHMDLGVDPDQGIVKTYRILWNVLWLRPIFSYCVILLTSKVAFAATDSLTTLKVIDAGMPFETVVLLSVPLEPVNLVMPLIISKYTSGPRPMDIWIMAYPFRVLLGPVYCLLVYWARVVQTSPGHFPWYFYAVMLLADSLFTVAADSMHVSLVAFNAKISDPLIGGTYMTLLNTVSNLGGIWPTTAALAIVDYVTWKSCSTDGNSCNTKISVEQCTSAGGKCVTYVDGYYIMTVACTLIGLLWLRSRAPKIRQLEELDETAWKHTVPSTNAVSPSSHPS